MTSETTPLSILKAGPGEDWLRATASACPGAQALRIDTHEWDYQTLNALVDRLCALLNAQGVVPGAHLAALLPNTAAAVLLAHAAARLGCVLVPLNMRLTADELAWQIDHADAARLVCLADEPRADRLGLSPQTIIRLPRAPEALVDHLDGYQPVASPPTRGRDSATRQAIVFTSGTTGFPKGAIITVGNFYRNAAASAMRLGVLPDDRWLACLPLYHVGGLSILFRSCLYGTAVVLHDGFDAAAVARSLQTDSITMVSLVPTMLYRLLHEYPDGLKSASLRAILLGGAAASPELLAEALRLGLPVALTYGLTEAASQVATTTPTQTARKPGTVGKPLPFSTVTIIDDLGDVAAAGEIGEIVVSGPTVMAGYYKNAEATAITLPEGRLRTGDLGYLDDEGDLWLVDRRSDLIVSGGENIYPAEVERALRRHPAVAAACVVGLPHPEWGQMVAAMVVPTPGSDIDETTLLDFAREQLAAYKRPRLLVLTDALPLTASGKIARRDVAAQLARHTTTEVAR